MNQTNVNNLLLYERRWGFVYAFV